MSRDIAEHLILGHMPLVGVSYQSEEMDKKYFKKFSKRIEIERVIRMALSSGITRFAAATPSSSSLSPSHLQVLREVYREREIEIIPCISIPLKLHGGKIDPYRRWSSYLELEEKHYPNVRSIVLNDPILNFRENWRERLSIAEPYSEKDFRDIQVDWTSFQEKLEELKKLPVTTIEPGSETDFLAATGRFDLLGKIIDKIHEHGFSEVIFGVHHGGETIPKIDEMLSGFKGYLTPINPMGVMMLPSKESAERAIIDTDKNVCAIKPFAGGRVKPEDAFEYIFSLVKSCMFGAASSKEVKQDVKAASKIL